MPAPFDESGAPVQQLGQPNVAPAPRDSFSANPVAALGSQPAPQPQQGVPQAPPPQITKQQVIAGLHHFGAVVKALKPILSNPEIGKGNIRPKIFDASATLIGQGIATVPQIMNGIKDLPSDPVGQKKWLEKTIMAAMQAEKKIVSDYVAQGPGQEPEGPGWSQDSHSDHMTGLMSRYKR